MQTVLLYCCRQRTNGLRMGQLWHPEAMLIDRRKNHVEYVQLQHPRRGQKQAHAATKQVGGRKMQWTVSCETTEAMTSEGKHQLTRMFKRIGWQPLEFLCSGQHADFEFQQPMTTRPLPQVLGHKSTLCSPPKQQGSINPGVVNAFEVQGFMPLQHHVL